VSLVRVVIICLASTHITGSHVAQGVTAVPPPQGALRIAPSVKRDLVDKCTSGRDTPSSAVNQLLPGLKRTRGQLLADCKAAGGDVSGLPSLYNGRFTRPLRASARCSRGFALTSAVGATTPPSATGGG